MTPTLAVSIEQGEGREGGGGGRVKMGRSRQGDRGEQNRVRVYISLSSSPFTLPLE